jgi:hypothetical protein
MRILALAPRTSILYYVAFVDRGDVRRVISLRALTDGRSDDMSKSSNKTPIRMPGVAEDCKITAAAKADPDTQPLTEAQLAQMVPAKALRGDLLWQRGSGHRKGRHASPRRALRQ